MPRISPHASCSTPCQAPLPFQLRDQARSALGCAKNPCLRVSIPSTSVFIADRVQHVGPHREVQDIGRLLSALVDAVEQRIPQSVEALYSLFGCWQIWDGFGWVSFYEGDDALYLVRHTHLACQDRAVLLAQARQSKYEQGKEIIDLRHSDADAANGVVQFGGKRVLNKNDLGVIADFRHG